MSLSVVQTAIKNADENPELYSPSISPIGDLPLKNIRLTLLAKQKLDAKSQAEQTLAKSDQKNKLFRRRENVSRWLNSYQYGEYEQDESIGPHEISPSNLDYLSLNTVADEGHSFSPLSTEYHKASVDKMPWPKPFDDMDHEDTEKSRQDNERPRQEQGMPPPAIPSMMPYTRRESIPSGPQQQGSDSTPSTNQSSVFSTTARRESIVSVDRLSTDSSDSLRSILSPGERVEHIGDLIQEQDEWIEMFRQQAVERLRVEEQALQDRQLIEQRRATMKPHAYERALLINEDFLKNSRAERVIYGEKEAAETAKKERLEQERAQLERQLGLDEQSGPLVWRDGGLVQQGESSQLSPPVSTGLENEKVRHPLEIIEEADTPTSPIPIPLIVEPEDASMSEGSLWNDEEPSTSASMPVQPTEAPTSTPMAPRPASPLALPVPEVAPAVAAVPTLDEKLATMPAWAFKYEFPSRAEARIVEATQRNNRIQATKEGRPEAPAMTLEEIMKIPSAHFRETYEASQRALLAEGASQSAPPAQAPEPEADAQSEADSDNSMVYEVEEGQVHGTLEDPDGPGWLRKWLIFRRYAKPTDLHLHPYKGYNIEGPKLQLIRAKNFLSAHDCQNTRDWEEKFDELCQYTKHLYDSYKDEDWGLDLFEVINMLQAHRIWEKYMFGKPRLNLDIGIGNGTIYPGPQRFKYDEDSVIYFQKDYRPPGAPLHNLERGSLAGKSPGLFIKPHCVENPPENAHIDPHVYTKGAAWYNEQEKEWVEWTAEHAVKEAWSHKAWQKRKEAIMPLPPVANWNGPVVNTLMDKDMAKTYETIKKYEDLISKLHRTAWKTAVYGVREALNACLSNIESGLQGYTTAAYAIPSLGGSPQAGEATVPQHQLPVRHWELKWLGYLTSPPPLKKKPVVMEREQAVFFERLEKLLANPRGDGVFATHAKKSLKTPLGELTDAINFGLKKGDKQRGMRKVYIFSEDEVWQYAGDAEELGMVHRVEEEKNYEMVKGVGELAVRGILPEQRIRWSDVGVTQESEPAAEQATTGDGETSDDSDSDSLSVASTISTDISVPNSELDHGDYVNFLPKWTSLRSWTENEDDKQDLAEWQKTQQLYRNLGMRLGFELYTLRQQLKEFERVMNLSSMAVTDPKENMFLNNPKFLRETLNLWTDDYNKRTRNSKNPAANGQRQTPLYKDIVEVANPTHQDSMPNIRTMWARKGGWDDRKEYEARETVRKGIIMEAYENKSNIWVARGDNSCPDEPGSQFPGWRQESLWTFGKPGARGFEIPQLFDMDRWPLHLQSEEMQEDIKKSGPPLPQVPSETKDPEDVNVRYAPTQFPGTGDNRTFWREGNEYWFGATPKQQREMWRRTHLPDDDEEEGVVSTLKNKVTGFFNKKRKRNEEDDWEVHNLRLPSPTHIPEVIENSQAAKRRAKRARLSG